MDEYEFGLSRDLLLEVLKAENVNAQRYFYPGLHHQPPFAQKTPHYREHLPNTELICASSLQLPLGGLVSEIAVERICNLLLRIHHASPVILSGLSGRISQLRS